MPRGVSSKREAMALFLNMDIVPPEMRPKGRGAAGKAIKVTVLKETAKAVTLQHVMSKTARAKQTLQVTATFPVEAVVLYEVEAVDVVVVDAPAPKTKAPAKKRTAKKAAPKKKGTAKKAAAKKATAKKATIKPTVITKAIRANKAPMKMPELVKETGFEANKLRPVLNALVEEGKIEKEGAGRSMTYGLVGRKKKAAKKTTPAKKRAAKKATKKKGKKATTKKVKKTKKRKGRKGLDEVGGDAAPPKKTKKKKGKKGKKKTRFGSSRRKSSFKLDPDDEE